MIYFELWLHQVVAIHNIKGLTPIEIGMLNIIIVSTYPLIILEFLCPHLVVNINLALLIVPWTYKHHLNLSQK